MNVAVIGASAKPERYSYQAVKLLREKGHAVYPVHPSLREIEGLSYEEIAHTMNCPIGTVRSRIFRAREAISARVKPLLSHQTGKRW